MKTVEEITKLAAEWWADKVCCPKFDNGDSSPTGGMTMMFAILATKNVNQNERHLFVESLIKRIAPLLEKTAYDVVLGVDYGPDRLLFEAANEANIPSTNFPWKTTMWVTNHHVAVSYGYCAPREYLYLDTIYCDQQIESHERRIAYCQDESNFYYEDVEMRKERMLEGEADARKQLAFWVDKKAEVEAGKGC